MALIVDGIDLQMLALSPEQEERHNYSGVLHSALLHRRRSVLYNVRAFSKTIFKTQMGEANMTNINLGRVVLGGIVAGIVMDVLEGVMNGVVLRPQWAAAMKSLGLPEFGSSEIILFNLAGLSTGLIAVWIYAAIRPRFGAGPRTALVAAAFVWVAVKVMGVVYPAIQGIYPLPLVTMMLGFQIVEVSVATLVGAWLYQE